MFEPVSVDDADVQQAMATVDELRPSEQRALILNTIRAVLAYEREGDVAHLTGFARNLQLTLYLRRFPEYVAGVRRPARRGRSMSVDEALALLDGPPAGDGGEAEASRTR
jgi:hypothetical protein